MKSLLRYQDHDLNSDDEFNNNFSTKVANWFSYEIVSHIGHILKLASDDNTDETVDDIYSKHREVGWASAK